jgi:hypothetical protein
MTKIEVEDQTVLPDEEVPTAQEQAQFAERLRSLCSVGESGPITADMAKAVPTSVLVMSVNNYPALAQEVAQALFFATQTGEQGLVDALNKTVDTMNTSYMSCSSELDIRVPARANPEDVGLEVETP